MIDILYVPYDHEKTIFGNHWCGPDKYEHFKEHLVAKYSNDNDGQPVEVYCSAAPARFYKLRALESPNSIGVIQTPFELSTGSGAEMAELISKIAEAVSSGMLGLSSDKQANSAEGIHLSVVVSGL